MDVVEFMRDYAKEIGGQFSVYDNSKSIIVVPLEQGRFQTVIGMLKQEAHKSTMFEISSKICRYKETINLVELLMENSNLSYSKFAILDDYVKIEAIIPFYSLSPDLIREMIREVAEVADHWEQRLTGVDVH